MVRICLGDMIHGTRVTVSLVSLVAACAGDRATPAGADSSSSGTDVPSSSTGATGDTTTGGAQTTTDADTTTHAASTGDPPWFDVGDMTDTSPTDDCGNGRIDADEACDDSNEIPNDGCENDCSISTGIAEIHAGGWNTCARTHEGTLRCWGWNQYGQLGNGGGPDVGDNETPAEVEDVPLDEPVRSVAMSSFHMCALLESGAVRCWGDNDFGELGYGDTTPRSTPGDDVELGAAAIAIGVAVHHTCALLEGGDVRCWGDNDFGELGLGHTDDIGDDELPISVPLVDLGASAQRIAVGAGHTCALLDDGAVRCWGWDEWGSLGNGDVGHVGDDELPSDVSPVDLGDDDDVAIDVAAGWFQSCALVEGAGLRCWGGNLAGELGYGLEANSNHVPGPDVDIGAEPVSMALGQHSTCVLTESGAVRCWGDSVGYPDHPQYIGDDETPASIGDIMLGGTAIQLANGAFHRCVLLDTKAVRCWGGEAGLDEHGALGYGNDQVIGDDEHPEAAGDVPVY